jgi:two-component system sensor histidine kinase TtrS
VLKNAVDAMSERGFSAKIPNRIRIDSYIVDHRLKLKIYDNGIGLSCSVDDFKTSFFSTKENGLGLGLAICNDVIMQFGGKINLSKCKDDPDSAWQMGCRVLIDIPLNNPAN